MNEIRIQFQGFHPSSFTQSMVDDMVHELSRQLPIGAMLKAVFKRENKMLTAQVRVLSAAGSLFATARGPHLHDVNRRLLERARRQLNRMRRAR
jgi:hypothetical protein